MPARTPRGLPFLHRHFGPASRSGARTADQTLDDLLFRWRRVHLGVAHRYLPKAQPGSRGTAGAPYLQNFYEDRLFDNGVPLPHHQPSPRPAPAAHVHARPIFSPLN